MCLIPVAFVTGGELPIIISFVDVNVISLHWESEHTELTKWWRTWFGV